MLAKGFAVDGAKTILVDIDEISLLAFKSESEEAAKSVQKVVEVHAYVHF
jgi:hypothetical protein